jgi:hypothetical protein
MYKDMFIRLSDGNKAEDPRMRNHGFDIREGEIAVELPEHFDAFLYFIGRIRTPWVDRETCPKNARESEAPCTIKVDVRWAAALKGVETLYGTYRCQLKNRHASESIITSVDCIVATATRLLGCAERSSPEARLRRAEGAGLDGECADRVTMIVAATYKRFLFCKCSFHRCEWFGNRSIGI